MKILLVEPATDDLEIERSILGDQLTTDMSSTDQIKVAVVHQTIVDSEFLAQFRGLRGVVRQGVGYDKVCLESCRDRGIVVSNVPDYCVGEVADTTLAMILDMLRGIREIESCLKKNPQRWQSLALKRVRSTSQLTLGVIGAGRIGDAVLRRAEPFGFQRIFYDPAVNACQGAESVSDLDTLLGLADIVSLHVPGNKQNRGMVDGTFIAKMKRGAMFVNTARGMLVADDALLLDAICQGQLSAIALDVLPEEPPSQSVLFEAWRNNLAEIEGRVCITPHVAFHSAEASARVRQYAAEEALRVFEDRVARYSVFE